MKTGKEPKKTLLKTFLNANFIKAVTGFFILAITVIAVGSYFMFDNTLIGPAFLVLGILSLSVLSMFGIKPKTIYPDMIFGFVDNSVLVFAAVLGGKYAGIVGAVVGGVAGNTITDGIGGLFEGYVAERQRDLKIKNHRNALSSSLGKMTGCLFGAGIGLTLLNIQHFIQLML